MLTCNAGHRLEDVLGSDDEWVCGGSAAPESNSTGAAACARGIATLGVHSAVTRKHCKACDYSLCDRCCIMRKARGAATVGMAHNMPQLGAFLNDLVPSVAEAPGQQATCAEGHALTVAPSQGAGEEDGDWLCDGSADPGGCSAIDKRVVRRWRCDECNFDMCDCCLMRRSRVRWLGVAGMSPEELEEREALLLLEEESASSSTGPASPHHSDVGACGGGTATGVVVCDPLAKVSSVVGVFEPAPASPPPRGNGPELSKASEDGPSDSSPRTQVVTDSIKTVADLHSVFGHTPAPAPHPSS